VLVFIGSGAAFGRPLLAPPGVPAERVKIMRQAFDRTMKDPEFLAEAAKLNMDIKPLGGEELQRIAIDVVQSPPEGLTRAKELIGSTTAR
jgi:tripartite-type tricarboxylate transporter receptor subunit TctC